MSSTIENICLECESIRIELELLLDLRDVYLNFCYKFQADLLDHLDHDYVRCSRARTRKIAYESDIRRNTLYLKIFLEKLNIKIFR